MWQGSGSFYVDGPGRWGEVNLRARALSGAQDQKGSRTERQLAFADDTSAADRCWVSGTQIRVGVPACCSRYQTRLTFKLPLAAFTVWFRCGLAKRRVVN